jgi:uncharacterized protein
MGSVCDVNGFEWDGDKEKQNIQEHGIDFRTASKIWAGAVFEDLDDREDYGEDRLIALGAVDNRVVVVVYTWRAETRRIISARKAETYEREAYYTALASHGLIEPD